jgi:hypothetical protein
MKQFLLVLSICLIGSGIFPINSQAQWIQTNGPYNKTITSFAESGVYLFAGTDGDGVYRSTNNGASWDSSNAGLGSNYVTALAVVGSYIFAGGTAGVYRSTDNGGSWNPFKTGLSNGVGALIVIGGNTILSGTDNYNNTNRGIYMSPTDTAGWVRVSTLGNNSTYNAFATNGPFIFASSGSIVLRSSDVGLTWSVASSGITLGSGIPALAVNGNAVFAGGPGGVCRSTDDGSSWTLVNNGLIGTATWVQALAVSGGNLCAGTREAGVYISTDNGDSWSPVGIDLFQIDTRVLVETGAGIFAGTGGSAPTTYERYGSGIFRSTNNGANWFATNYGLINTTVSALIYSGKLIAGTSNNGVYVSQNEGRTWVSNSGNYLDKHVLSLAANGADIYAGTQRGVYYSINSNLNWAGASAGLTDSVVKALVTGGVQPNTVVFAGTASGVFVSTNKGSSWNIANAGLINTNVQALARRNGTTLFAGTSGGIYFSADSGVSWIAVNSGLGNLNVLALAFSGTNLFAGTAGGIFLSTDNGSNWTDASSGLTNTDVRSFAIKGTNIFAGTMGGIFQSTDNGTNWVAVNSGLSGNSVLSLAASTYNLFAGTSGTAAWRRPLSEIISSIQEDNLVIPQQYYLEQNYPNPFNPATTIRYQLPVQSHVTLKVFDVLGREVTTLVNENKKPGSYEVEFNSSSASGGGLPSGVYFYRLQAGSPSASSGQSFVETKKLLLLK